MNIRLATENDYEQLIQLYSIFVGDDRYETRDNDSFQKVLRSSNNFIYVAEVENKLVGFATFSVRVVIRYPKPIAELDELYVNDDYRRHGIGHELMAQVERKAKKLDCYRLYIESQYKHTEGHAFYEALGYKNYGYHFFKNL